jgi:WD40 repeat protein
MSGCKEKPNFKVSGEFVFGDKNTGDSEPMSSRARHIGDIFLRHASNSMLMNDSTSKVGFDSSDPDSSPPSPSSMSLRASHFRAEPEKNHDIFNKPRVRKFVHRKIVNCVSFSPDGRMLATGSKDKFARIFDVNTGKEILKTKEFGSLVSGVNTVSFSSNGHLIAIGSGDGFARVFNVHNGKEIMKTFKHGTVLSSVNAVCFSPDGKSLATGSQDKFARIFLVKNGREVLKKEHGGHVTTVCYSPDGAFIATGCHDTFLRVIDARDGKDVFEPIKHCGTVNCVVFSPVDGKIIASGSTEKAIRIFHVCTCYELSKITELQGEVLSLSFSPDGKRIAAASSDHCVHIFDVDTGKKVLCLLGHAGYVSSVSFSPVDGMSIATGSKDNVARIFDIDAGKNCLKTLQSNNTITCFCVSPDGSKVATGNSDYLVRIFDIYTGREIQHTTAHGHTIVTLCFSPDSRNILTGCTDGFARMFDISSGQETLKIIDSTLKNIQNQHALSPSTEPIVKHFWTSSCEVSACHEMLKPIVIHSRNQMSPIKSDRHEASMTLGRTVQPVIESHFNSIRMSYDHQDKVTYVCFSNDGKKLATGCSDKCVRIFEFDTGKLISKTVAHEGEISSIGFSPSGQSVVTSSKERLVRIFDVTSGIRILQTVTYESKVIFACFLPTDGNSIAIGSDDYVARIFNLEIGQETLTTKAHGGCVSQILVSPDAKFFATCSSDNFVRIFLLEGTDLQHKQEVQPCMIFPGQMISFSSHDMAWRMAFVLKDKLHVQVLLRPLNIQTDVSLPVPSDLVLLWSCLDRSLQRQWFFSDAQVVLSEFTSSRGAALFALASKWHDSDFPNASSTFKRLCETDEPVVNAGLILGALITGVGGDSDFKQTADAAVIKALLGNVGRHLKFAARDEMLAQELIRAACIPGIQHIIHEFWTFLARPIPSHPISVRNVKQVSFSRSTRMYVSGSDSQFEPVFENYFSKHSQAKGPSLEFEHYLVPFFNPSAVCDTGQKTQKTKSFMQVLVETNDIDVSNAFLIVRAIVQFRWQMYGLKHWMREFYVYTMNLGLLVTLSIIIWQDENDFKADSSYQYHPSTFIVTSLICAFETRSLYREAKQFIIGIPSRDGKTSFLKRILSSSHYAHGREFWNWVELLHICLGFCAIILVWTKSPLAIPVLSVACFLRWWGLLFYIQVSFQVLPFLFFGVVVLMLVCRRLTKLESM